MLAQSSVVLPIIIGVVVLLVGSGAFVVSSRSKRGELAPPTTSKAVTTTDRPTELLPSEVAPAEADVDSDVEADVEAPLSLSEELDALEGIEARRPQPKPPSRRRRSATG